MTNPRVLWLSKSLSQGGAETLLLELAADDAFEDFDIDVAATSSLHLGMKENFEALGFRVHDLGGQGNWDFGWVLNLRRLQKHHSYDVVHVHAPLPSVAVRLLLKRGSLGPKVVTTEHNVRDAYRVHTGLANRITGALDDHVFAVSRAVARSHEGKHRSVEVLYHGRAPSSPATPKVAPELRGEKFNVLMIANLRPEKNIHMLLEAAAILREPLPSLAVTIVGDGPLRAALEDQARALNVTDLVTFLGHVPSARSHLADADVLVLTSDAEGLPVVLMEAAHAGVPVVCTRVGGVPEIVRDGHNGLLVPAREPHTFAAAIVRLANDSALMKKLAAGALEVAPRFAASPAAHRYADIYRELLDLQSSEQ